VNPRALVWPEGLEKLEKLIDVIGSRTRGLQPSSIAPAVCFKITA
jgi:hypothetical protein